MAYLRVEVCQVCHVIGKPIERYRIGDMERLTRMPLCQDCVRLPFTELLEARPRRRRAAYVPTTMEAVEAAKKASPRKKRRTAKKS